MLKTVFSLLFFSAMGLSLAMHPEAPATSSPLAELLTPRSGPAMLHVAQPTKSGALTADDEKAIRTVIQGQLDALAKDDADKAFSFAAPNVREAFRTAPRFLDMVQRGYPVVYRPASVSFLKVDGKDKLAFQRVQMTDQAGEPWLATYSLERQKTGVWRITGCAVVENRGRMT